MDQRVRDIGLTLLREAPHVVSTEYNEDPLTALIADRLNLSLPLVASATRKKCNFYPGTRDPIDLLIQITDGPKVWIECKCAWKTWAAKKNKVNGVYRKHLLHQSPKEHSAYTDIMFKLPRIGCPGDYVGELIIGFDSKKHMLDYDMTQLIGLTEVNRHPWETFHSRWADPENVDYSFGLWLFVRPIFAD